MIGKLTVRALSSDGHATKIVIDCTLEHARWMINRGIFFGGVWETVTNRIYL